MKKVLAWVLLLTLALHVFGTALVQLLRRADAGIAMGGLGSDAAIEAADLVLMDDDLGKLARAVRQAKKTLRIARQNISFALLVKVGVMLLGVMGHANMWLAVFADVGVAMLCILNALRAMGGTSSLFPSARTR